VGVNQDVIIAYDRARCVSVLDWSLRTEGRQKWPNIRAAAENARSKREQIKRALDSKGIKYLSNNFSLVVFGSLARDEWTENSDLDWGLLVDSQAHPEHLQVALQIAKLFKEHNLGKEPGRTGTFGNLIFSHELVHRIGGENDPNSNITRRLLLLLESCPIGSRDAYSRVIHVILERYFDQDTNPFSTDKSHFRVPRFLLNDVVRFWRTMAVDFAGKQWERAGEEWALRNIKLRMSRKLIFVAGLLMCFSCYTSLTIEKSEPEKSTDILIRHVSSFVERPPLEILADALLRYSISTDTVTELLNAYDLFLQCLNDAKCRTHLEKLPYEESISDTVFQQMRRAGHQFQHGLDRLFFQDNEDLRQLIRKYGVF
jgi:predicted nucleotidyltransferase